LIATKEDPEEIRRDGQ